MHWIADTVYLHYAMVNLYSKQLYITYYFGEEDGFIFKIKVTNDVIKIVLNEKTNIKWYI